MARTYRPTGKPRGRPKKDKFSPEKLEQMVAAVTEMAIIATGNAPLPTAEEETGLVVANGYQNVRTSSTPLTKEEIEAAREKIKGQLAATASDFAARAPELLARLATWEPEKALKLFLELVEFTAPKVNKVEVSGGLTVSTFVHVEEREPRPSIDAEFTDVPS